MASLLRWSAAGSPGKCWYANRQAPSSTRVAIILEVSRGEAEATKGEVRARRSLKGAKRGESHLRPGAANCRPRREMVL